MKIDLELFIAKLLRRGVLLSAILIFTGWAGVLGARGVDFSMFHHYQSISLANQWMQALEDKNYFSLLTFVGLGSLVLLPPLRVFMTGVFLLIQKEKILGWMALVVFFCLVLSFSLGIEAP